MYTIIINNTTEHTFETFKEAKQGFSDLFAQYANEGDNVEVTNIKEEFYWSTVIQSETSETILEMPMLTDLQMEELEESEGTWKDLEEMNEKAKGIMILFDMEKYDSLEDFANHDDLFWNDLNLHMSNENGCWCVCNTNSGNWYSIESKYSYLTDLNLLIKQKATLKFDLISDEGLLGSLYKEWD